MADAQLANRQPATGNRQPATGNRNRYLQLATGNGELATVNP
jgi:hypothetical protein